MAGPVNPLKLDPVQLADALDDLERRVAARFPDRRLRTVAAATAAVIPGIGAQVDRQHDTQRLVRYAARGLTVVLVAGTVVAMGLALADFVSSPRGGDDWLALVNNVIADLVYVAVAVAFLW